jgi:uncharacterized membrane protein YvlD (DUF360 family)
MNRLFWHWAISAIALVLAVAVAPHARFPNGWYHAIWIAPLLGLINLVVGFFAGIIKLIFVFVNLLTLGIFGFIVSFLLYTGTLYWLFGEGKGSLANYLVVQTWVDAALVAVIMALFSTVLNMVLPGGKSRRR